jgi:hypothetical protein
MLCILLCIVDNQNVWENRQLLILINKTQVCIFQYHTNIYIVVLSVLSHILIIIFHIPPCSQTTLFLWLSSHIQLQCSLSCHALPLLFNVQHKTISRTSVGNNRMQQYQPTFALPVFTVHRRIVLPTIYKMPRGVNATMDATVTVVRTICIELGDSAGKGFILMSIIINSGRKSGEFTINMMIRTGNRKV